MINSKFHCLHKFASFSNLIGSSGELSYQQEMIGFAEAPTIIAKKRTTKIPSVEIPGLRDSMAVTA
jgi:hypothetical protein